MGAATRTNRAFVMPHSPSMGSFRDSRTHLEQRSRSPWARARQEVDFAGTGWPEVALISG